MRIAVIGAGISGLSAAYALKDAHEVVLFEESARAGGHANTLSIDYDGREMAVDTGFMVYNEHNYPNLTALFAHLGVATHASDMSFSVSESDGLEWSSNGLGGLFAWKRNLTNPGFLCMLGDIVRFSAQARSDLAARRIDQATLEEYVADLRLGRGFVRNYLLPMGAAIWSTPEREMLRFPAESFLRFFDNHRLLHAKRPQWRTVVGGSRTYVDELCSRLGDRLRAGDAAVSVAPAARGLALRTASNDRLEVDHVVLACHAEQAASILAPSFATQRAALADIRTAPNVAYLHRDLTFMPRRRAAWASWNYLRGGGDDGVCVTYWMNRLQDLDSARPVFVTLNPKTPPAADKVFARLEYAHPQFDARALAAQNSIEALQGADGLSFAGAWLGFGFHEDGLKAGLNAARRLGGRAPWDLPHAAERLAA